MQEVITKYQQPDSRGYFGQYGGKFVPEILIPAVKALEEEYERAKMILRLIHN